MGQINKNIIVKMYKDGVSMRKIALSFNTNHKLISRILKKGNVETREPLNLRNKKKFECDIERLYNNMATHLRFDVSTDWLMGFKDFEKLKTLNNAITNRSGRYAVSSEWYKEYILKFYYDSQFNDVYQKWVTDKTKYKKPSLDHIEPKSKGGVNNLDNLQFLSWFENRCKNDMNSKEWNDLKQNINSYFI